MSNYEENTAILKKVNGYIIRLFKPDTREDAIKIPRELQEDTIGIINLNLLEANDIERASDFFTGYMYGVRGKINHIGENVYICSPQSIIVEDKTKEEANPDDTKIEPIIYHEVADDSDDSDSNERQEPDLGKHGYKSRI